MKTTRRFILAALGTALTLAANGGSQLVDRELRSEKLANTKAGTNPARKMVIYLPAGYDRSSRRYPVIYFLPTSFESYRAPFDQHGAQTLFDRAIEAGVIDPFILVAVDMTRPLGCSWYVNRSEEHTS